MTGGGTGGHINPLVSVAAELQVEALRTNLKLRIRYIGSTSEKYMDVLRNNGIEVRRILGSKLRRYFSIKNFVDAIKFAVGILQAFFKVLIFFPDVVFSKGGPGSVPVVLVSRFFRIPVVIHESDSIPSITGRLTSKFAEVVAISFKSASSYFAESRAEVVFTGNPIRNFLLKSEMQKEKAKTFLEFDPNLPLLLVLGGSQGAEYINNFVLDNLVEILKVTQVFHQTGASNYENVGRKFSTISGSIPEEIAKRYKAIDYIEDEISIALSACDVVLSRAGASGIFEVAAFGKPSILIPIANSANNHQLANASEYSKAGAAVVFEENNMLPNLFLEKLQELLGNAGELSRMSAAAKNFYVPDAALKLARILLTISEQ